MTPVDFRALHDAENAEFVAYLGGLSDDEWDAPSL